MQFSCVLGKILQGYLRFCTNFLNLDVLKRGDTNLIIDMKLNGHQIKYKEDTDISPLDKPSQLSCTWNYIVPQSLVQQAEPQIDNPGG